MAGSIGFGYKFDWDAAIPGIRPRLGSVNMSVAQGLSVTGETTHEGSLGFGWKSTMPIPFKGDDGVMLPSDRFHFIVEEARTGNIVSRDLIVSKSQVMRALSGPCAIEFDIDYHDDSVSGIVFEPWGHYIHAEKVIRGKRQIWATAIVQPSEADKASGILHLRAQGFSAYPKGMPWLENWNPLTNDAFEPVHRIWNHLQSFPNGNLNVEVFPEESGVEMLPGYAFDGDILNFEFFATFVRAVDKLDCGDFIDGLAKDIPFDYFERSEWNANRTNIIKKIELAYPRGGVYQEHLAFVINENVYEAKPHIETEIDWISDVGVSGWAPGKEYSFELANADPDRLRRYLNEQDAKINSNERAAAWAKRRLARRQAPSYWESIIVDMEHPNAPFGYYDVGDTIWVSGFMPWIGDLRQEHKILAISVNEEANTCELLLMAEGAFNYDQIFFPEGATNIIPNPTFTNNLNGWQFSGGTWVHDATQGVNGLGSAKFAASGVTSDFYSDMFGTEDMIQRPLSVMVKVTNGASVEGVAAIELSAQFFENGTPTTSVVVASLINPVGNVPWTKLAGSMMTPDETTHVMFRVTVRSEMLSGTVNIDNAVMQL